VTNTFDELAELIHSAIDQSVGGTTTAALPRADHTEPGVDVCLLGVTVGSKEIHRDQHPLHRLPMQLEFLAAVAGPAESVPGTLYELCAALDAASGLELSSQAVPIDWWLALGVRPRPAVRVIGRASIDRPIDPGPVVTERVHLEPRVLDGIGTVQEGRA
jgi:hypothetical protein